MVLKHVTAAGKMTTTFENDVKMYGTQTANSALNEILAFENDVKMYGTQTKKKLCQTTAKFENDVKMYGTQTARARTHAGSV